MQLFSTYQKFMKMFYRLSLEMIQREVFSGSFIVVHPGKSEKSEKSVGGQIRFYLTGAAQRYFESKTLSEIQIVS